MKQRYAVCTQIEYESRTPYQAKQSDMTSEECSDYLKQKVCTYYAQRHEKATRMTIVIQPEKLQRVGYTDVVAECEFGIDDEDPRSILARHIEEADDFLKQEDKYAHQDFEIWTVKA